MTRTFGAETASSRASSAACGMTCSQLSITISRRLSRRAETKLSVSRASGATVRSTSQANGMKSAGSSSIARSKNHVPSEKKRGQPARDLDRNARLADAAGAGDRDDRRSLDRVAQPRHLFVVADEPRRTRRNVAEHRARVDVFGCKRVRADDAISSVGLCSV